MKHTCIKPGCANSYEDDDPDAYYCPPCLAVVKSIAAEIDKTHTTTDVERPLSPLQVYEEAEKKFGGFVPINALL